MRRAVVIVGLVLMVSACGEDTLIIPEGPPTTAPPVLRTVVPTPVARWNPGALSELCLGWEREFMEVPAPDRQAHVNKLLRAITASDDWATLSVDERRQVEAVAQRALVGDC